MPRPYFYSKDEVIDEILRVNHAGEYGAVRIYEGQIDGIDAKNLLSKPVLDNMLSQELQHLSYFESQIKYHNSKPTIFLPIWNMGGYLLGKISAKIGSKSAMLCTEAVEEVIDEHYTSQKAILEDIGEYALAAKVEQFRIEELEHRDVAIEYGSREAPVYNLYKAMVSGICKLAIWMSKMT